MMHYYGNGYMSGFFPGFGILLQLLLFLAFILIIWWVIKSGGLGSKESAEEILKKRLAKGEITKKEYESLKKEISK